MKRDNFAAAVTRLRRAYDNASLIVHGIGSDSACAFAVEHVNAVADIRAEWADESARTTAFTALAERYESAVRRAAGLAGAR